MAEGGSELDELSLSVEGVAESELQPADILRQVHRNLKKKQMQLPYGIMIGQDLIDRVMFHKVHSSSAPICVLKKVALSELPKDQIAYRRKVCVRVLEEGIGRIGWRSVVEDEHGNTCALEVYNYPRKELFSPGTVLIIKEPCMSELDLHVPIIRCDCPTDIVVVIRGHPAYSLIDGVQWTRDESVSSESVVPLTAEEWERRGDDFFENGNVPLALECYLLGLKPCSQRELQWKLLNERLIVAYLSLGYYEMAIRTARLIPNDKMAQHNLKQAYYQLRGYGIAHTELQRFLRMYPEDREGSYWSRQAKSPDEKLADSTRRIERLVLARRQDSMKMLDHANYSGPVETHWDDDGFLGVRVTRDLSADTIVIISKAVASSFNRDKSTLDVLAKAVQVVSKNPETIGKMIYDLSFDGSPKERILPYSDEVTKVEPFCDVERMKGICKRKTIAIQKKFKDKTVKVGAGLFLVPSYMKHSCDPNVYCSFINDVMVVYCERDLYNGDELYFNYTRIPITSPFHKRRAALVKRGLRCNCYDCIEHRKNIYSKHG